MSPNLRHKAPLELWLNVPYLVDLPESIVRSLADCGTRRVYRAGETIFLEGEPVAGLFLVEEGSVKISRFSKDGREHIIHLLRGGETFNDVAALDGGPNPVTAAAHIDAVTWCISRVDLRAVAERNPALAWALVESIARRARFLVNQVQDLSMRNVRGRLARLLLDELALADEPAMERMLTQEDMAARLGTVREVVGRALRGLAADGVLEFDRHQIVILDPADEAEV